MASEGVKKVINWEVALEEVGAGEWDFLIEMLAEFYTSLGDKLKMALTGVNTFREEAKAGELTYARAAELAHAVHYPSHTLKGTAWQCSCMPLGDAAKEVEQLVRYGRDHPEDKSDEARDRLVKGLQTVSDSLMKNLWDKSIEVVKVLESLEEETLIDEGVTDESLDLLAESTEENLRIKLKAELAAFEAA